MFALWGFAVAIAYVPTIYSAPFMPRWWALAIGIGCIRRLDLRDVAEPLVWCLGLVVLWSGLTLLWSPALFGGALLVGFLVLFVLILMASASADQDDRDNAFSGFALGILLSAGIALAQKYGHIKGIIQSGDNMPVGLFFNQEVFAETAAPIVVWCLLQDNNAQRFIGAVIATAVMCTSEHVAIFAIVVGLAYGVIRNPKILLGFVALAFIGGFLSLFLKVFDSNERILLWATAIRSITFFGRGIGWWYQAHPFGREEYVHSDALQAMVESGVAGVALCLVPCLALFRGRGTRPERAVLVVCILEFVFSFPLHMPATTFVFAVAAGAVACRRADVYIPGLQGRAASGFGLGSTTAYAASLFGRWRWRGALVSTRSAYPQYPGLAGQDGGTSGTSEMKVA